MRVKILDVKEKPFTSSDGEQIRYFWYTALRSDDGVQFTFGSLREHPKDTEADLNIIKTESDKGKIRYKEVA